MAVDNVFQGFPVIVPNIDPGVAVASLTGTLTGTTDGALADVADGVLSTSDTYTDAAVLATVDAVVLDLNLQLKELQTKQSELLASLRTANIIVT